MLILLMIGTFLVVMATLLPLVRHPHWVFRSMEFPRLQISIIAMILLLADLILLDIKQSSSQVMIAITGLCLIWQLRWITPYTILWPNEVKRALDERSDRHLSFITVNVLTQNRNSDALIKQVKLYQPDVLVTLESDQWWQDKLDVLEQTMPYSVKCPLDNLYGMHVYSKLPLKNQEIAYLVEQDVPSIHASLVLRSGDDINVHFMHPAPPSPTENTESAERDAELIILAKSVAETNKPVVVTGDLNDVAWSATTRLFRKISGLLDPRVGSGMFNTFHASYPFLRWPLDHLFHSQHFTLVSIERLPSIGSDHFGLFTKLLYLPLRGADQEGLKPDKTDHDLSKEIAKEQSVSKSDVPKPSDSKAV